MLRSSSKRLRVALFPSRQGAGEDTHAHWNSRIEALENWFREHKPTGALADVVLSDHYVKYAHIPWSPTLETPAELQMLASATFEAQFGDAAAAWDVCVDLPKYGRAGLACAIDRSRLAQLQTVCAAHNAELGGVQPYFMLVFNHHRASIGQDAALLVIDNDKCVFASIRGDEWHSIRSLQLPGSDADGIAVMIQREYLLQGIDQQVHLFVHAKGNAGAAHLAARNATSLLEMPALDDLASFGAN